MSVVKQRIALRTLQFRGEIGLFRYLPFLGLTMMDINTRNARPQQPNYGMPEQEPFQKPKRTSTLGIVALVFGVVALLGSLVPFLGALAIFLGLSSLVLGVISTVRAKRTGNNVHVPATATGVSFSAIVFSLIWVVVIIAIARGPTSRNVSRSPVPPAPMVVRTQTQQVGALRGVGTNVPAPQNAKPTTPVASVPQTNDDERAHKQLLEDLARDRLLETIRSGPGLPITATKLEEAYQENIVAAELKYKNAVLELTGTVIRVTRDNGSPFYTLKLEGDAEGAIVNCDFTEKAKHPLAALERGHTVKLRGLCVGRENDSIRLKDCIVVK
jgi:hypothetical protein